jgi:toxin-antitoxin system PIN domain toxin
MTFLSCPDVNVWLALLTADHVHHRAATRWWEDDKSKAIVFCRMTQLGVLRLLTTSAMMNGKPLTMIQAWAAYDRLFTDDRVAFTAEPAGVESQFRAATSMPHCSPKMWADEYLIVFARHAGGRVVTFDRAVAARDYGALLLA